MDRKWLEKFYTECGREVSLAYNVLNQTNNWGVTMVTAFLGGIVLSSFRLREEGVVFLYPTYVHWFMVIGAWIALLRFFARSSLALTNMYRWNELIYASSRVLSVMKESPALEAYEKNCATKIDAFYYRFKSPRPKLKIVWHGLKLMYLWFFLAVLVLFVWGLISLPRQWGYYVGIAAFLIPTILEVYWFATWYGMEYECPELAEELGILDAWKLEESGEGNSGSTSKAYADSKGVKGEKDE